MYKKLALSQKLIFTSLITEFKVKQLELFIIFPNLYSRINKNIS